MNNRLRSYLVGLSSILIAIGSLFGWYLGHAFARDPLSCRVKIYVNQQGRILMKPMEGYEPKSLPVVNMAKKKPGCYIACHSTNPDKAIYAISPKIYVIGLIRVQGQYDGPFCRPKDYDKAEIRDEVIFKELCSKTYQCIGNSCWAGGDTGEIFGLK